MQNQTVSSSGVYLRGNFNEWNSDAALQNDGTIYYTTLELESGTEVLYKFVNGNEWESLTPDWCNKTANYTNRYYIVPDENITLDPVCFNSCSACNTASAITQENTEIKIFPNPTESSFKITNLPISESLLIKIYNTNSQLLRKISTNFQASVQIELSDAKGGVYLINIIGDDLNKTMKIIKEDRR